jgi:hypothetical protein
VQRKGRALNEITNVPPFDSSASLGGRVLGASPADYRVAVFIYVPSAGWWSKPYCDPQLPAMKPLVSRQVFFQG